MHRKLNDVLLPIYLLSLNGHFLIARIVVRVRRNGDTVDSTIMLKSHSSSRSRIARRFPKKTCSKILQFLSDFFTASLKFE